jgi:hypothetical protein
MTARSVNQKAIEELEKHRAKKAQDKAERLVIEAAAEKAKADSRK